MAEILEKLIGKLVDGGRNAFIKGRQINYATLVANECEYLNNKEGMKDVTSKLELENAYDLVIWDCLLNMLKMMNIWSVVD